MESYWKTVFSLCTPEPDPQEKFIKERWLIQCATPFSYRTMLLVILLKAPLPGFKATISCHGKRCLACQLTLPKPDRKSVGNSWRRAEIWEEYSIKQSSITRKITPCSLVKKNDLALKTWWVIFNSLFEFNGQVWTPRLRHWHYFYHFMQWFITFYFTV